MAQANTKTDPDPGWRIVDEVIQLREWGNDRVYDLPRRDFTEVFVGSSRTVGVRLDDIRVSRRHARLVRERAMWWIHDLGSKNGTWVDGVKRPISAVNPLAEIGLGPVTLVAESRASIALRELLCRWIGWSAKWRPEVDRALRGVREGAAGRLVLLLSGAGNLVPIAERLHRELLGATRAFVVHDDETELARSLETARGGTICFSGSHTPDDIERAVAAVREPMSRIRVTVCSRSSAQAAQFALKLAPTIRIHLPQLAEREDELSRIIEAYVHDAAEPWSDAAALVDPRDIAALAAHPFEDHAEIEAAVRRLVVIRLFGITDGARRLGITHGSLSQWAKRRGLRT